MIAIALVALIPLLSLVSAAPSRLNQRDASTSVRLFYPRLG